MRIETARLIIRPLDPADAPALQRIGGQPEVARMLGTVGSPWTLDAVLAWIEVARWRDRPGYRLAVCLRNGLLIGQAGLGGTPVSCGYFIDPDHAGQGHATEAVRAVLADAFRRFDLPEVCADHFADNPASGRVLEKLGFERTRTGMGGSLARLEPAPNVHYRLKCTDLKA